MEPKSQNFLRQSARICVLCVSSYKIYRFSDKSMPLTPTRNYGFVTCPRVCVTYWRLIFGHQLDVIFMYLNFACVTAVATTIVSVQRARHTKCETESETEHSPRARHHVIASNQFCYHFIEWIGMGSGYMYGEWQPMVDIVFSCAFDVSRILPCVILGIGNRMSMRTHSATICLVNLWINQILCVSHFTERERDQISLKFEFTNLGPIHLSQMYFRKKKTLNFPLLKYLIRHKSVIIRIGWIAIMSL